MINNNNKGKLSNKIDVLVYFSFMLLFFLAFDINDLVYYINQEINYNYEMVTVVSKLLISIRLGKNKKNDVVFHVRVTVEYLTTTINLELFQEQQIPSSISGQQTKAIVIANLNQGRNSDLNVLPDFTIAVPSRDRINDFPHSFMGCGNSSELVKYG